MKTEDELIHDTIYVMKMADRLGERCGELRYEKTESAFEREGNQRDNFREILNSKLPNRTYVHDSTIWATFHEAFNRKLNELRLRQDAQNLVNDKVKG
jgi:hypothetical protein